MRILRKLFSRSGSPAASEASPPEPASTPDTDAGAAVAFEKNDCSQAAPTAAPIETSHPVITRLHGVKYYKAKTSNLRLVSPEEWNELDALFAAADDPFELLEEFRPAFEPWWAKYHALLDIAEKSGYAVRPLEDYLDFGLRPNVLHLYHDVHAWDILPALGIALANRERGVCSTFYLLYGFSSLDIEHAAGYRVLTHLVGDHVRVGLHAGPFSNWLRFEVFDGDDDAYENWAQGDSAAEDLRALFEDRRPEALGGFSVDDARHGSAASLEARFGELRSVCPSMRTANHHGDHGVRVCNELRKIGDHRRFTDPGTFLHRNENRDLGILASPRGILADNADAVELFNEGRNAASYLENLADRMTTGKPIMLINHPAAFPNLGLRYNIEFASEFDPASTSSSSGGNAAAPTAEQLLDRGIYLCGFARGGTTWARRVVGAHPDVFEAPGQIEFQLPNRPTTTREYMADRLRLGIKEDRGGLAAVAAARHFVTKSPPNSTILADMMAAVPKGRFLYILRDPRDVLISHQRTGVKWTNALSDFDMAMPRTATFYDGYRNASKEGTVHAFRYEDLHQRFPETFRGICEFAGLEVDDTTIEHIMHATSFAAATGGREHKEKSGQHKRSGVIREWSRNLYSADETAFRASSYWNDMFETHGYDWNVLSLANLVESAAKAGVPRPAFGDDGPGLRIVWSLSDSLWDYPELIVRRLREALSLSREGGFDTRLVVDDALPPGALKALAAEFEQLPLALEFRTTGDDDDKQVTLGDAFDELEKRTADTIAALSAKRPQVAIDAATCEQEATAADAIRQRGFDVLPLRQISSKHSVAVLRERFGTLTASGPPQSYDPVGSRRWEALAEWAVTLHARPLAHGVAAPLALGFRSEFADLSGAR